MITKLYPRPRSVQLAAAVLLCAALVAGCQDTSNPVAPDTDDLAFLSKKPSRQAFDVTVEDHAGVTLTAPTLEHTANGFLIGNGPSFTVGWADGTASLDLGTGVVLVRDLKIAALRDKKTKMITAVWLQGLDADYPTNGLVYRSDEMAVDPPVDPSDASFTLHVHADNVPVREKQGDPDVVFGYMSLADIVYTPAN